VTIHRRGFLGASCVSMAGGAFAPRLFARAAEDSARALANDHALVVVELTGGNDGLNTVIPFEDPLYYRNRRTLAVPRKEVIRLDDRVGLHPKMAALGELYREGRVAVVQGVGYPEPNRSHFRSMEIWQTASTAPLPPAAGWLGRYLDAGSPAGPSSGAPTAADPAGAFPRGLALNATLPQAMRAARADVAVVARLDELGGGVGSGSASDQLRRKLTAAPAPKPAAAGPVDFLRRQADTLYRTADHLKRASAATPPPAAGVNYADDGLANQFRRAGQLLAAGLGVRVLYCAQDGYDTHASQAASHGDLLATLSDALAAFQRDLTARGLADRVAVLVYSEFGRRVDENASRGTDHGAASCVFVVGPKVKAGLAGTYPSLSRLGDGDLIHTTDFRSVYAAALGRWLGGPSGDGLDSAHMPLDLFS